jgi:hypothetical protein
VVVVNTRNKRASALGLALIPLVVLPAPDASVSLPDRQQVTACYAGISAGELVVYDFIEATNVELRAASATNVELRAASAVNVSLEPD